jgi:AraC family transcriptional regulator, exoenzyme S synthesis regulatory protein ExsA
MKNQIFFLFKPFNVYNLYETIKSRPGTFRQFTCRKNLVSLYNCPLDKKFEDVWSHHNYIIYVVKGKKTWHTPHRSFELTEGTCFFVKKGASIIEQFFEVSFCLVMFFLPDDFITDVLKNKTLHKPSANKMQYSVVPIDVTPTAQSFFLSMITYFDSLQEPDPVLLELKFKELVLTIADNPRNPELLTDRTSLLHDPGAISLERVMEENFCYNLKLEEFARLSNRSLSSFKRDFQRIYNTTPGKWLNQKRLEHAKHLLVNLNHTVSEAAFESGFEHPAHFSRCFRNRFGLPPTAVKLKTAV